MKFFDLYAGIGGFRLAMESLGHEYVGSCEIDFYARETYKKGFGKYPQWNDATKLDPKELPDFDCLCAGFPCQAFSVAGNRAGFADTRGTLFFEIVRIAREKRPKLLFLENVKGLLSHDQGRTFETMLNALDEVGYDAEWQVINGKHFLPQNRERIFIIGHLRGAGGRKIFPIGESDELDNRTQEEERGSGKGVWSQYSTAIDASYYKGHQGSGTLIQVGNVDQKGHNSLWGRVYDPEGIASTINAEGGGLGKMNFDAYKEGKKLIGGKFKEVNVFNMYVGGMEGHGIQVDNRVTITIGHPEYWNGVIKLSKKEAMSLAKALIKARHQVGSDDQKKYKVAVDEG